MQLIIEIFLELIKGNFQGMMYKCHKALNMSPSTVWRVANVNNKDILDEISPRFLTEPGTKGGTFSDKRPPENRDLELRDLELRNIEKREKDTKDNLTSLSVSLLKDFENITGTVGGLNLAAVKKAVELHGSDNVKMAIDKALEKNKPIITYIGGILKNWKYKHRYAYKK